MTYPRLRVSKLQRRAQTTEPRRWGVVEELAVMHGEVQRGEGLLRPEVLELVRRPARLLDGLVIGGVEGGQQRLELELYVGMRKTAFIPRWGICVLAVGMKSTRNFQRRRCICVLAIGV